MKLTTKQNDDLAVRRGKDKEGQFVELQTEDSQYILTPWEADRLGEALIKAAQPKQKKAVSEALARLRRAMLTEQVRAALRHGMTIAEVQAKHPTATKRFVEEQRAFLRQTEGLADTRRTGTGAEVARLTEQGWSAQEIAGELNVSRWTVYIHRRKQKKV